MKAVAVFLLLSAPALADIASCRNAVTARDHDKAFRECAAVKMEAILKPVAVSVAVKQGVAKAN